MTTEPTSVPTADAGSLYGHTHKKRRRPHLKMPGMDITGLNLTAMMDMMTILLVFLVKSYSVDAERINVNDNLRPPASSSALEMKPAVTVTVTAQSIMVEEREVVRLNALTDQGDALIPELQNVLISKAEFQKTLAARGNTKFDGSLLLVAHEDTPFSVLTAVLYTAGQAQFSQFRLLLLKKRDRKSVV